MRVAGCVGGGCGWIQEVLAEEAVSNMDVQTLTVSEAAQSLIYEVPPRPRRPDQYFCDSASTSTLLPSIQTLIAKHKTAVDISFGCVDEVHPLSKRKFGTICVGMEVGKLEIVQDLVGLISFKDHVFVWLSLEKTFTRLLELMKTAEKRIDMSDIAAMLSQFVDTPCQENATAIKQVGCKKITPTATLETAPGDSADDYFERNMLDI
ncbi:hypothetical protein BGZ99_004199 [Dissophora globulifera]|uniref:Uncharacterized protein n=1 Tax=Dissophora globulifera TaxID=979702 RepID=A0A9P6UZ30_9FUNG|nr:hypothetical protein BGZ99_004199 [Dissophora globulifera]